MTAQPDTTELRTAEVGELAHDRGSEPDKGWFIVGEKGGYFDVDNACWAVDQEEDAPWTSEHFDLHGTILALLDRLDAAETKVAAVEALLSRWEIGANEWGTCGHEWVSLRNLRAALGETANQPTTDALYHAEIAETRRQQVEARDEEIGRLNAENARLRRALPDETSPDVPAQQEGTGR